MHVLAHEHRAADARLTRFEALYRREFAFVWATARRLGVPPAAVEDAVQDVFVTAYRRLDQLGFEISPRAWLHGVTRRVASRYHRSAFRLARRLAAVSSVPPDPEAPPHERLAAAQQVERLLARLGERTRAAFEMAELLGMSGPEIAAELRLPVATVYSRVRLAREQLLRELGSQQLERGLDAAREDDAPPADAARRTWLLLAPGLGPGSGASTALAALVSARAGVMTTLLLAAGVVVAVAPPREDVSARASGQRAAAPPGHANTNSAAPAPATSPTESDLPDPASDPTETAPLLDFRPAARPTARADRLAAEVILLDRARAALADGDVAGALARLGDHARLFPDGALIDLRRATEVEVLCRQGRFAEASAQAAALFAAHPDSSVAQRFRNFSCAR